MTATTKDPYAFDRMAEMGSLCRTNSRTIALDVWRRVKNLTTGEEDGTCKRERMRTLGEVFRDLRRRLDLVYCPKCGWERKRKDWRDYEPPCLKCGAECVTMIDEYFSGPDKPGDLVPHDVRWIACYPVTGGSEGHYVHVEFASKVTELRGIAPELPNDFGEGVKLFHLAGREPVWKITRLALGKTFHGFDHAAEMARRCAKLLGA